MTSFALRIWVDNDTHLWYNTPMSNATDTTPTRIIPRHMYNEYAYAFGFLRSNLEPLFVIANNPYYSSPEDRITKLELEILRIETLLKQMESEMYPNDSE